MADQTCRVHGSHRPAPLRTVLHHIQPQAMGGRSVADNMVWVCDTGHYNIHRLLGDLIRTGKMRKGGSTTERYLAREGYDAWVATGRPGRPVFEAHLP